MIRSGPEFHKYFTDLLNVGLAQRDAPVEAVLSDDGLVRFQVRDRADLQSDLSVTLSPDGYRLSRTTYDHEGKLTAPKLVRSTPWGSEDGSYTAAREIVDELMDGLKPLNPKRIWSAQYLVPREVDHRKYELTYQDGGQALIYDGTPIRIFGDDGHFFARLQSWHERPVGPDGKPVKGELEHPVMRSLMGRRIRITIDTID